MSTASTASTATPVSTGRGILLSVVIATVAASIVNTVISLVAQALGANASVVLGLTPAAYIVFTVVGLLVAAVAWVIIGRRSAAPEALLRWLAPTVVVLSMIPDLLLGLTGVGWLGVVCLMLMHLVVAAAGVLAFRRFLPLPR